MYLAYTYFVRNKITNQFYYGSRCKNIEYNRSAEDDLWIHYFTSSKEIAKLRKIHNNDLFETIILYESPEYEDCYWKEQELIKENISNVLCLNKQFQDRKTGTRKFSSDGPCSEERRKAISKSKKGEKNHFYGKSHSAETKQKIRVAFIGRISPNKGHIRIMSEDERQRRSGTGNPMFGRKHSEETKQKIREKALARTGVETPVSK